MKAHSLIFSFVRHSQYALRRLCPSLSNATVSARSSTRSCACLAIVAICIMRLSAFALNALFVFNRGFRFIGIRLSPAASEFAAQLAVIFNEVRAALPTDCSQTQLEIHSQINENDTISRCCCRFWGLRLCWLLSRCALHLSGIWIAK